MRCFLISGGLGTRLRPFTDALPKNLVPILGKPLLEWQVGWLGKNGIDEIVFCIGHKADAIQRFALENLAKKHKKIKFYFSIEEEMLGTGGALRKAVGEFGCGNRGMFAVTYGDIFLRNNIPKIAEFHRKSGFLATAMVRLSDHPHDSDIVRVEGGAVVEIIRKGGYDGKMEPLAIASFYIFSPSAKPEIERMGKKYSIEHDLFERLAKEGRLGAYASKEFVRDVGTWERLKMVESMLAKL